MPIDPQTGLELPPTRPISTPERPLDEAANPVNHEINDELEMRREIEDRRSSIWLPIVIGLALLMAAAVYFVGTGANADLFARSAGGAVTHSEPSPH